jgi:beta-lactamase class A
MKRFLFVSLILPAIAFSQPAVTPITIVQDSLLTLQLTAIVHSLGIDSTFDVGEDGKEQISLAVIDLSSTAPRIGGVNPENFIYPASVYKMYVAATVLKRISEGDFTLWSPFVVRSPNDVDRERELANDPRPLLRDGDTVTVNYLLDLMITRSDNTAANCLIDLAGREKINALMHEFGWQGSEVTRKFLSRRFEDPGYTTIRGTETCALHAAQFMYRVYSNQLVNPWVSRQMKSFLGRQLDTSKLVPGLPRDAMFYHKTGWFSYWTNDVGIVEGRARYVVACFLPLPEESAGPMLKELSRLIYDLMLERGAGQKSFGRE